VHIVYVATPHSLHYENVLQCLEAGKHVCCEVRVCVPRGPPSREGERRRQSVAGARLTIARAFALFASRRSP
jgi:hypothetical protein